MGKEIKAVANLIHNAKRCYVYEYGKKSGQSFDGKITISKRIIGENELDITDALENREIEIVNSSTADNIIDLLGIKVDDVALMLLTRIIGKYEETGTVPDSVEC